MAAGPILQAFARRRESRERRKRERRDALRNIGMLQLQMGHDPTPVLRAAGAGPDEIEAFSSMAKTVREMEKRNEQQSQAQQVRDEGTPEVLANLLAANAPQSREAVVGLLRRFETPEGRVSEAAEPIIRQVSSQVPIQKAIIDTEQEKLFVERRNKERQRRDDLRKQTFDNAKDLRKEFVTASKDFVQQRDAFRRVRASVKNPSPAGDLALIFNYMKVLDPNSVVRESEFATAAATGAFGERVQAAVQRVVSGERLSPPQRADFARRASLLFQGAVRDQKSREREFTRLSRRFGLEPRDVVRDLAGDLRQSMPSPPASEPDAIYFGMDPKTGNPTFQRADGSVFEVTPD